MEKKLLSVSEFAKLTGMSRQAVYKKIKTDNQLSTCVNRVDNHILIDIEAFEQISVNQTDNQVDKNCQPVDNQVDSKVDSQIELIEILKRELEEKNKQIEILQKLLDQEQQLHLIDKNKNKNLQLEVSDQEETQKSFLKKIINLFTN